MTHLNLEVSRHFLQSFGSLPESLWILSTLRKLIQLEWVGSLCFWLVCRYHSCHQVGLHMDWCCFAKDAVFVADTNIVLYKYLFLLYFFCLRLSMHQVMRQPFQQHGFQHSCHIELLCHFKSIIKMYKATHFLLNKRQSVLTSPPRAQHIFIQLSIMVYTFIP